MRDALHALRVLGPRRMGRLRKAYRLGWEDCIQGYFVTRIVQTLIDVGAVDAWQNGSSLDVAPFCEANGLDAGIFRILCDSLVPIGILNHDNHNYALTAHGRDFVDGARGWFEGVYSYHEVYCGLTALLRGEMRYGQNVSRNEWYEGVGGSRAKAWMHYPLAVAEIRALNVGAVLDLHCADARFLRDLCAKGSIRGIGWDPAPALRERAADAIDAAGVADRVVVEEGGLARLLQPGEVPDVDLISAILVLHEFLWKGEEQVIEILRAVRERRPALRWLILEAIRPTEKELKRRPGMMVHYLVQHELSHQRLMGMDAWRGLFAEAGYQVVRERYFGIARCALWVLGAATT